MQLNQELINDYLTRKFGSPTGNESVRRALMDGYNFAKQERVVWQCSPKENPYGIDKAQSVIDDTLLNQTIDAETRELAKQLYVFNPSMGAERAIKQAKLMVKLLNEQQ